MFSYENNTSYGHVAINIKFAAEFFWMTLQYVEEKNISFSAKQNDGISRITFSSMATRYY